MKADVYEALANQEAKLLERIVGHSISHGEKGACPSCGHLGFYDMKGFGLAPTSIYFSIVDGKWRCMACEVDSFGC
jgi:hypothetical protein